MLMVMPARVTEAVREHHLGAPSPSWQYAIGIECRGAVYHSPAPMTVGLCWITPEPLRPKDAEEWTAWLCPTCAGNLRVLQDLLVAMEGEVPWPVRREFGNQVRALALNGWERWRRERGVRAGHG